MAIDKNELTSAEQRYLHLAQRFRFEMPEVLTFGSLRGPKRYAETVGLLKFQDAMVLGGEWIVVVGGEIFCDFLVQTPSPPETAFLTRFGFDDDVIELIHEQPRGPALREAFLLGGCRNYSHWLLDYLPRLRLRGDASLPLIVNGPIARFQSEALKFLGIEDDELIQLEYPATLPVRDLFYPGICSSSITPPHPFRTEVLTWLRDAFAPLMTSDRKERRIFISRKEEAHAWGRRLLNHEEVESIAKRHDFEIVALEKLGFAEQVRLFSSAAIIAGAHGAGFTNMVFAPAGTKLVELIGPQFSDSAWSMEYATIAQRSQQDFTRIVGQGDKRGSVEFNHLPYETYFIDPKEFESVLDE
jgi:hypothetical protein